MPLWAYITAGVVAVLVLATAIEMALRKPGRRPLVDMRPTDFDDAEEGRKALGLEATDMDVVERATKMNNMMGLQYGSGWPGLRKRKGRNAK